MVAMVLITVSFAQVDSAALQGIVDAGVPLAEQHWPSFAKIVAALALVSELLSLIPNKFIPANGVIDAVIKVIKAIGSKK